MDLKDITPEAALGGVGGASMIWLFFKRVVLRAAADNMAINAADAQSEVINLLRSEVERLSDANKKLAERLNDVQIENVELRSEMSGLRDQINAMTERFNSITRQSETIGPIKSAVRRKGG